MRIELARMSQEMDLNTGDITNFIVLRLPNGELIRGIVDEEGAAAIVNARINGASAPPTVELGLGSAPIAREGDIVSIGGVEAPIVFGGGEDPDPATPAPAPVMARPRPRSVSADEYGYPVTRVQGGVDPSELAGGHDADEDGFGQL